MACDVQVKLDDLMVPSGLKVHKSFLTSCPNEVAPCLDLSWLCVSHSSFIVMAASRTISGPGAVQVAGKKKFLPGFPHKSGATQCSGAQGLAFRLFICLILELVLEISVSLSPKKCICQRILFSTPTVSKACELVPTSVGPCMHLSVALLQLHAEQATSPC